jgi:hypothetical protein
MGSQGCSQGRIRKYSIAAVMIAHGMPTTRIKRGERRRVHPHSRPKKTTAQKMSADWCTKIPAMMASHDGSMVASNTCEELSIAFSVKANTVPDHDQ